MIKIAIIDDDKGFLIKYKSMTEEFMNGTDMDYTVDTYDSAEAVLESAMDYELYCLDVEMPGIDGFQLAEKIRRMRGRTPDILLCRSVRERFLMCSDIMCLVLSGRRISKMICRRQCSVL